MYLEFSDKLDSFFYIVETLNFLQYVFKFLKSVWVRQFSKKSQFLWNSHWFFFINFLSLVKFRCVSSHIKSFEFSYLSFCKKKSEFFWGKNDNFSWNFLMFLAKLVKFGRVHNTVFENFSWVPQYLSRILWQAWHVF